MERKATKAAITAREITCEKVVRALCEKLERGVNPWVKPWGPEGEPTGNAADFAVNLFTGRPYSGINQAMLEPGYYVTARQAREHGGRVLVGKGQDAVFYKVGLVEAREEEAAAAREALPGFMEAARRVEVDGRKGWKFSPNLQTVYIVFDDGKVSKQVPILRDYRVWNVKDTEGLEAFVQEAGKGAAEAGPRNGNGEAFIEAYRRGSGLAGFFHDGGDQAYYRPGDDTIHLPAASSFVGMNEYYSTAFHEMTHSTGHASRLHRQGVCGSSYFGSQSYSKEELVAEIGAAMAMGYLGISTEGTVANSAAYLASWASHLRGDRSLAEKAVMASAQAKKAFAYMAAFYEAEGGKAAEEEDPRDYVVEEPAESPFAGKWEAGAVVTAAGKSPKGRASIDPETGKIVVSEPAAPALPAAKEGKGGASEGAPSWEVLLTVWAAVEEAIGAAAKADGRGRAEARRIGIIAGAYGAMLVSRDLEANQALGNELERRIKEDGGSAKQWKEACQRAKKWLPIASDIAKSKAIATRE